MSEENVEEEKKTNEESEESGQILNKNKSKKKLYIIIGAAAFLIILITTASIFIFSKKESPQIAEKKAEGQHDATKNKGDLDGPIYYNLDEFIVNLNSLGGQASFLKISITLELVGEESVTKVETKLPVIKDTFQVYLRELRADDLQGSAGIFRLRQELLLRLNKLMYPVKINDILFRSILVQ